MPYTKIKYIIILLFSTIFLLLYLMNFNKKENFKKIDNRKSEETINFNNQANKIESHNFNIIKSNIKSSENDKSQEYNNLTKEEISSIKKETKINIVNGIPYLPPQLDTKRLKTSENIDKEKSKIKN